MDATGSMDPLAAVLARLTLPLLSSLLIGALVTWGLQGVLCVQVYNYYLSFPKDPIHMKLVVYISLALELAQTLMVTSDTYKIYAIGFGDLAGLDQLHLLWLTLPMLGGLVGLICHFMFAYRISILSESRLVGCFVAAISLGATVASFTFGGKLFIAGTLSKAVRMTNIYLTCGLWNGFGALCDVVIAVCMSYYLSRNQTGFRNTDLLITRIIRLTIETGVATATASIASAVLFVGFREKLTISVYFVVPAIMITKLYSITILATFNNRPQAVGGPPAITDIENSFDSSKGKPAVRHLDRMHSEIRIGRSVTREVWTDPIEQFEMYSEATQSVKESEYSMTKPDSVILKDEDETPAKPSS